MHNLLIAIKSNYARCPGNHKLISLLHQNRNAAYPTTPATVEHENYLHISGRSGVRRSGVGGQNGEWRATHLTRLLAQYSKTIRPKGLPKPNRIAGKIAQLDAIFLHNQILCNFFLPIPILFLFFAFWTQFLTCVCEVLSNKMVTAKCPQLWRTQNRGPGLFRRFYAYVRHVENSIRKFSLFAYICMAPLLSCLRLSIFLAFHQK